MGTKPAGKGAAEADDDRPVRRSLLQLKADDGDHTESAAGLGQIVDESMGAAGELTALLYKSREVRPA